MWSRCGCHQRLPPVADAGAFEPVDPQPQGTVGPFGPRPGDGDPIELDMVVPASGNMRLAVQQLWMGPAHAGRTVRVWADCDLIHLTMGAARIKTIRSHLSVADLSRLRTKGAVPAGRPPLPRAQDGEAVEVERLVSRHGLVALGPRRLLAAEILAGRLLGIRIEPTLLMFFDPDTRQLLRVRLNPLTPEQMIHLRGARRAGPPPRPSTEPVTVHRRASATGVILVCRQRVNLGRIHAGQVVAVAVSETTLGHRPRRRRHPRRAAHHRPRGPQHQGLPTQGRNGLAGPTIS